MLRCSAVRDFLSLIFPYISTIRTTMHRVCAGGPAGYRSFTNVLGSYLLSEGTMMLEGRRSASESLPWL